MDNLPIGLYDLLHTKQLHSRLEKAGLLDQAKWINIAPEEIHTRLAVPLSREIAAFIREVVSGSHKDQWISELESVVGTRYILQVFTSLRVENTGKIFVNKDIGYSGFSFSEKKSWVQYARKYK